MIRYFAIPLAAAALGGCAVDQSTAESASGAAGPPSQQADVTADESEPAIARLPTPIAREKVTHDTAATRILDQTAATRLLGNTGITLQWIGWEQRGQLSAEKRDGTIYLNGGQLAPTGESGLLSLDGRVIEIGEDYFLLDGAIVISDTPDIGRNCFADKVWRFEVTQGRKYWRLREFEWCDYLTDYVDIYF